MMFRMGMMVALWGTVLWAGSALAAPSAAQKCQASKNKAAGKYAACREKAEAKLASTGDTAAYETAITKCETKYQSAWQKAEQKAVDAGSSCTTTADETPVKAVTDAYTDNVAQHLGGAPLEDCPAELSTCNGSLATCNAGTAAAGDVLSGKTFSSSSGLAVSGTMPNNGAVMLTPSTADQAIAAGYHNGSGKCAGDASLLSGNIKSGATIFGVAGSSTVVDTSGATATAPDMVSGKTAYANGSLVTGSAAAGSNVSGPNGAKTFTIPDGLYSGSKTATANDSNLVGGNILTGATIFGVAGTQPPSQPLKTGQTTVYGTGSDAGVGKGEARSYTDNGDGTVSDNKTGLMWEKKSRDGSIHDYSNAYTWSGVSYGGTNIMDGTITSTFLATLNAGSGFAWHTDWRIPNQNELLSLVNYQNVSPAVDAAFNTSCAASCTVLTCSCTPSTDYWSSTTYQLSPNGAWLVDFNSGDVSADYKSNSYYLRAVRGGS